uniref:F-box domain-containing protein n=1 Tax=Arundo donax TaxID=35708 RepID=A0A0A8ZC01_ARUDO
MDLLGLKGLVSMQPERKLPMEIQACDGSMTSVPDKKDSLCQQDDHSPGGEISTYSGPKLPKDIWSHIHSLMPLCDSAHSACVSRTFLRSWRSHPKLIFTEETLGLKQKEDQTSDIAKSFTSRVDRILKNHSGVGVKILKLVIHDHYNVNTCHLNSWLQNTITPGIEEVTLFLPTNYRTDYNLPCSGLLDGRGNSIRYLYLTYCAFRRTFGFDCLRSLTKLHLMKCVSRDELGFLISSSFGLEQLELGSCRELICLKIPFWLERLSCLAVYDCDMLQVIESAAPSLSTFDFFGDPVQLSFGESSKVKSLTLEFSDESNSLSYAITKLPSIVSLLETLTVSSTSEGVNTPIVANKFLHLKYLKIYLAADDDEVDFCCL